MGLAFGMGVVGPEGNKRISPSPYPVSGGSEPGPHARAYVEMRWEAPVSLRTELFYNRFVSDPNTTSTCCGGTSQSALRDETLGVFLTPVFNSQPYANVAGFLSVSAGLVYTLLGTNPTPSSAEVADYRTALGFGAGLGTGVRILLSYFDVVVEARYQQAFSKLRGSPAIPVTLGIQLR